MFTQFKKWQDGAKKHGGFLNAIENQVGDWANTANSEAQIDIDDIIANISEEEPASQKESVSKKESASQKAPISEDEILKIIERETGEKLSKSDINIESNDNTPSEVKKEKISLRDAVSDFISTRDGDNSKILSLLNNGKDGGADLSSYDLIKLLLKLHDTELSEVVKNWGFDHYNLKEGKAELIIKCLQTLVENLWNEDFTNYEDNKEVIDLAKAILTEHSDDETANERVFVLMGDYYDEA